MGRGAPSVGADRVGSGPIEGTMSQRADTTRAWPGAPTHLCFPALCGAGAECPDPGVCSTGDLEPPTPGRICALSSEPGMPSPCDQGRDGAVVGGAAMAEPVYVPVLPVRRCDRVRPAGPCRTSPARAPVDAAAAHRARAHARRVTTAGPESRRTRDERLAHASCGPAHRRDGREPRVGGRRTCGVRAQRLRPRPAAVDHPKRHGYGHCSRARPDAPEIHGGPRLPQWPGARHPDGRRRTARRASVHRTAGPRGPAVYAALVPRPHSRRGRGR